MKAKDYKKKMNSQISINIISVVINDELYRDFVLARVIITVKSSAWEIARKTDMVGLFRIYFAKLSEREIIWYYYQKRPDGPTIHLHRRTAGSRTNLALWLCQLCKSRQRTKQPGDEIKQVYSRSRL